MPISPIRHYIKKQIPHSSLDLPSFDTLSSELPDPVTRALLVALKTLVLIFRHSVQNALIGGVSGTKCAKSRSGKISPQLGKEKEATKKAMSVKA